MIRIVIAMIFMNVTAMEIKAQNGSIKGNILDKTDQALVTGATVSLLLQKIQPL